MSCSLALVFIAIVKRMCGMRSWRRKNKELVNLLVISQAIDQWTFTLYTGWTAGSCLNMAMPNTSVIKCVLSRCVTVWWIWKSDERTQILASSQSYSESVGRKIGFSFGSWPSWNRQLSGVIFPFKKRGLPMTLLYRCGSGTLYLYGYGHDLFLIVLVQQTDWCRQVLQCAGVCTVCTDTIQQLTVHYVNVTSLESK